MIVVYLLFMLFVAITIAGTFAVLFDGTKLQPTAKQTLLRHCEEQHAAMMRGDYRLGIYGRYPPVDL